jgi:hypothetical protein
MATRQSVVNRVAASATDVVLFSSATYPNAQGVSITNISGVTLYIKLNDGAAVISAGTENYTVALELNDYYETPFGYIGDIHGIWDSASGFALVNVYGDE